MRTLKSHPLLKLANGYITGALPSTNLNFKFSNLQIKNSIRGYSSGKPLGSTELSSIPNGTGTSFDLPYIVLDTLIVDHIINNHSIASLKEVIDNQIFANAFKAGLLVVGNFYRLEIFIPLTVPGELQLLPLLSGPSKEIFL